MRGKHVRRVGAIRRWLVWIGVTSLAALLVIVGGIGGYMWYLDGRVHRVAVDHLSPAPEGGADRGTENILFVGSTDRCALHDNQNASYGLCSQGVTGVNSDVIMIAHLDGRTHDVSLLSIPRDLFAPNARKEGAYKIDAALYQGPSQLVDAIRTDLGISIQHYVELNFDTFAAVVDALGGVHMGFPVPVFDGNSGLNITAPGCVELDGLQALQLVRARHLRYRPAGVTSTDPYSWPADPQSDLSRIRRDQTFLSVLATSVQAKGLGNLTTDQRLAASVAPNLKVDQGFSVTNMVDLVLTFHATNPATSPQFTLPVVVDRRGSYTYRGRSEGDVVWPDMATDRMIVRKFLGLGGGTNTLDGSPLPAASTVRIAVSNGTSTPGLATATASALGRVGFVATPVADSAPVGSEAETVVYYARDDVRSSGAAQAVADELTGNVILAMNPNLVATGSDVTVVTGSSFGVRAPTSVGSPANRPSSSPSVSIPGSESNQAPSAAIQTPAPWDPTACASASVEE